MTRIVGDEAKAFTAFLTTPRYYEVRIVSNTEYELYYRDDPDGQWIKDSQNGVGSQHCVFPEAKAFILDNWWIPGTAVAGDKYRFSADPETDIVEIPVLFWDPTYQGGPAKAYTSNCVNVQVDGNTVFIPDTFGPVVDREGTGTVSDIFRDYVESAYALCGYTPKTGIKFADARWYHSRGGSIHCGTNVVRTIPTDKWWEFGP